MKNTTLLRNTSVAALMAAILALPSSLHAAGTFTWSGATNGGWPTTGTTNWVGNSTITSDNQTDLVFNSTTNASGMWIGSSRTVRSLSFGSGITSNIGVSFNFFNSTAANLTMSANTGNASVTVDAGEVGSIFLGFASGIGSNPGALILSSNLDVIHNGSGQLQFNRVVSGTGNLTKTGPGELAFTGGTNANTYSGLTTVSGGNLTLFKTAGTDAIAGNVLVNGGTLLSSTSNNIKDTSNVEITSGTYSLLTFSETVNNVKLTGGSITSTTGTLTSTTAFDLQSGTSSAKLSGTAGATKSTSGTVVLSGANTISGLITVNAGTLNFSASGNTLSGGATVNSGTLQLGGYNTLTGSTLTVNSGGTLLASTSGATGQDMDSASSLILNGGTLRLNPSFVSGSIKSYNTVPVTVSSASTMSYENAAGYSITLGFGGTNAFALNADLTVQNNSTTTTVTNPLNISRAITGTGAMIVETYNNISSSADNYSLGRVQLSGSNSGWSGNLVVSKGTVVLSGSSVPSAGTGTIILGITSGSSGAGLTFNATSAGGTTVTHTNSIIVRSGGFRSIKGNGDDHSIILSGDILLEGNLNVDHTLNGFGFTKSISLSGNISGVGGIDITRAGGSSDSYVVMSGSNSFTGAVNINNQATLIANSSSAADLNTASAINLGGGTLDVRVGSGVNKTYDTAPVNVSSASTLQYRNVNASTYTLTFSGTSAFALNADLTVQNVSTNTGTTNAVNISRALSGTGNLIVETYNNIASSADPYSLGRVLLSGSNSGWSGNLEVAKGTVSLSGSANPAASGAGKIILGTTSGTFGAGLTFFSNGPSGANVTYGNEIIVRSGGFRSIKGSGTDQSVTFTNNVLLEGDLNLDSTFFNVTFAKSLKMEGIISGTGGLNITRSGGSDNTSVVLSGSNTYTGATTISSGRLHVGSGSDSGSIETTSAITNDGELVYNVGSGIRTLAAAISGTGTLTQNSAGGSLTLTGSNTYTGLTSVNNGTLAFGVSETLTGGLTIGTSGTAVLLSHTGSAVRVLDISSLTISGTTPFVGGGKDISLADGGLGASPAPVPEPATWAMLLSGLGLLSALRRAKSSQGLDL